jgi:hypothetical protein
MINRVKTRLHEDNTWDGWYHRDKQGEEETEATDLTFNLAKPEQET